MSSSSLKNLIRREVDTQQDTKIGTVLTEMRLSDFDGFGAGVWVADIQIGSDDYLRNVPIKAQTSRFYAQIGQTVSLRKNARGRWDVVGPGDRISGNLDARTYDLGDQSQQSQADFGFESNRVPFSYYATLDGIAPLGVLWADGVTPFNLVQIVDAGGNPV